MKATSIFKLLTGVFIIVVMTIIYFFLINSNRAIGCQLVMPIDQGQALIDSLDKSTNAFASTTVDLMGRSAEGGLQTTYTKEQTTQIVEQRFYGETGRSYMRFYYSNNKLFAIVKLNLSYAVPLSVDNSGAIKSSEERDYFLDQNGQVCNAFINHTPQVVDKDTQAMIKEYVNGIL